MLALAEDFQDFWISAKRGVELTPPTAEIYKSNKLLCLRQQKISKDFWISRSGEFNLPPPAAEIQKSIEILVRQTTNHYRRTTSFFTAVP